MYSGPSCLGSFESNWVIISRNLQSVRRDVIEEHIVSLSLWKWNKKCLTQWRNHRPGSRCGGWGRRFDLKKSAKKIYALFENFDLTKVDADQKYTWIGLCILIFIRAEKSGHGWQTKVVSKKSRRVDTRKGGLRKRDQGWGILLLSLLLRQDDCWIVIAFVAMQHGFANSKSNCNLSPCCLTLSI